MDRDYLTRTRLAQTVAGVGITIAVVAAIIVTYLIWRVDWGHIGTRHWKVGLVSILAIPAFVFFGIAWLSWSWAGAIDPSRPPLIDPNRQSN
jgi:hypothetical protein